MDGLADSADTILCTNCGNELRRGMLRCRECGHSLVEAPEAAGEEFELSGHELVQTENPKCPLCGADLEPGSSDCAACTSALVDQLLPGPEPSAPAAQPTHKVSAKLHVRRAQVGNRDRSAPGIGPSTKLREAPSLPPLPHSVVKKSKPAAARSKPVNQRAEPAEFAAANQQVVNEHAAKQAAVKAGAKSAAEEEASQEDASVVSTSTTVETDAACTALLASLATADAQLRCGIATALGKLGDKQAMAPLERHLSDQDIRVRRAVATALVQLGHPKGEYLLDIAERKPAAAIIQEQKSTYTPPKPRRSSGGESIDGGALAKIGSGLVAVALIGGGIWYWMNQPPSSGKGRAKSAAAKKSAAKKPKSPKGD